MIFLPDTNAWIRFVNTGDSSVKDRFLSIDPEAIKVCSVVKAELYYGAVKSSRSAENIALLDGLFMNIESFPFDDSSARRYAQIRAVLDRQGTPIGPHDLMIAAIALVRDAVVVTHNTKEFSRVEGLRIEEWEKVPSSS